MKKDLNRPQKHYNQLHILSSFREDELMEPRERGTRNQAGFHFEVH